MTCRQRYRLARTAAAFLALCTVWSIGYARGAEHEHQSTSDGRYAACGVVTEEGVTEHLNAYVARCGR